jgi:hypothetical protein
MVIHADVLISAGHEGRPASCKHFPQHKCNLGAAGEREWTPIVADEATRILRAHGMKVVRLPADFAGTFDVKEAVFIHFDGASPPCTSRASIGYPPGAANAAAAARWRALYSRYWPFGFMPDNFTDGLREYYAYKQVRASKGVMTIELGEVTCPAQRAWLTPRVQWEGAILAYFLAKRLGFADVPPPRFLRPG